ncbi:Adaptive-response+sensory-kinase+SasA [Methylocapsa aurea]|uniref:PAS domain-containing sensor histidine kinase n=1 Tax=Methylocapsa aurea TaxID=663610 RepID=UPI003D18BBDB
MSVDEQGDQLQDIEDLRRLLLEAGQNRDVLGADATPTASRLPRGGSESPREGSEPPREGSEHFCRRLLEQMREGSIELAPDGAILHCNRQFREMIGRPAAQLIGDSVLDHVASDQRERFAAFFAAPEAASGEFEFRRADGSMLAVSVALGAPAEDARPRLAIVTDLTQTKWMERSFAATEALREREKWSRLAVAAGGVGTFDVDLITGANRFSVTMHEILGLAPDQPLGFAEADAMLFEADKQDFERKFLAACAGAKNGEWSHEMRIRRMDGALRWIALAGQFEFRRSARGVVATRAIGAAIDVTDRREIEDSLRRSNERLRLALAAGAIGSWEYDVAANVTEADQKYREIYGFPADMPLAPEVVFGIVHPDDVAGVRASVRSALDPHGEGRYQAEFRIRRMSDGALRWIACRAQALSENGRAERLIGVVSDITEKKATEGELREKARLADQLAGIAASVPGLIASYRLGADGKASMPYASPNVEDIYGMDAESLRQGVDEKFARVHPDDLLRVRASIEESARALTVWRESYRYDHPHKGWIWVEAQSRPTREPDGATLWHGYLQDVTERKRIEQALVDKEARLYATVEGAHDAILTVDEKGAIQSLNSAAVRMFGYAKAEAIGAHVETLVPVRLFGGRKACVGARFSEGAETLGNVVETQGRRKDGALFPIDLAVSEASYHGRRLYIAFIRDLTERRKIEARMQKLHAERLDAVGELAAGLAHELNQPLSATAIYLKAARRLLQMPVDQRPANVEDALDNAATQIVRAGQIIAHLREFISRGEPDKTLQNLHDILDEAHELVIVEAKQSNINVAFRLDAVDDRILADRVQIKQVLVNLMRNARDAMGVSRTRKMTISTSLSGRSMIRLDVADTGAGLSEEARVSLFEPFATTKPNGLGVGLTIARSIVEAHYGKIWAGPNGDGGATFSFTLPLAAMEEEE